VVVGVFWENMVGMVVFVDTRGWRWDLLVDSREEMVSDRRLEWVTHYYLMNLPSILWGNETKEMCWWGRGSWVFGRWRFVSIRMGYGGEMAMLIRSFASNPPMGLEMDGGGDILVKMEELRGIVEGRGR